jgi:hypothetical protein
MIANVRPVAVAQLGAVGSIMRGWIIILLSVLVPVVARANPYILDPSSLIAFGAVALWALIVETGIVALLLVFRGLSPLRMFCGYFLTNVTVFIFVFCPLRDHLALPILEALVVAIDAAFIILLSKFAAFQGDSYRKVSWWFACLTSLAGNAASFFVGAIASGAPWEMHGGTGD